MVEYREIHIDFDIHKLIESNRLGFDDADNDVLRRLLDLPVNQQNVGTRTQSLTSDSASQHPWRKDGVELPHGTRIRMTFHGKQFDGTIDNGRWLVDGVAHKSPSGAAVACAHKTSGASRNLNGWRYWEVKRPGDLAWTLLDQLST